MQCARCHDHKFDPILQKDYFRLQAFFAPLLPRDDLFVVTSSEEKRISCEALRNREEKTAALRREIDEVERPHETERGRSGHRSNFRRKRRRSSGNRCRNGRRSNINLPSSLTGRSTYEYDRLLNRIKGPDKDILVGLYKQLAAFDSEKPRPLPVAFCVTDVGPQAPPVKIPKKREGAEIAPAFLEVLATDSRGSIHWPTRRGAGLRWHAGWCLPGIR